MRDARPGFGPLLVGLHWPSLPWGDEEQSADPAVSFSSPGGAGSDPFADMIDDAADKLADTPKARAALDVIFRSALQEVSPTELPTGVAQAFRVLADEAGLGAEGPAGAPGDDAESFDPVRAYDLVRQEEMDMPSFGGPAKRGMTSLVRQLSFWRMKKRAREFGESGGARLLSSLQEVTRDADRQVRFHLMGHSFGCIVASATVAGPPEGSPRPQPIDTLYLVQGALSSWAFCSPIPVAPGKTGYFHPIVRDRRVSGPILTTFSEHDTAVGKLYPIAAGARRQVVFDPDDLPKYVGLGTWGMRGPGVDPVDLEMKDLDSPYQLQAGTVYNLKSDNTINEGSGASGAHNDIAKPEVGHALWQAVMATAT